MFIIYSTAAIGVLVMVLYWLVCINAAHEFKVRYPMLEIKRSHWSATVLAVVQMIVIAFVPLFNILLAYVLIFKSSEVIEKGIDKIHKKCTDEVTNV